MPQRGACVGRSYPRDCALNRSNRLLANVLPAGYDQPYLAQPGRKVSQGARPALERGVEERVRHRGDEPDMIGWTNREPHRQSIVGCSDRFSRWR